MSALADYAKRYAPIAARAGAAFSFELAGATGGDCPRAWDITERLPGSATTDFGAPGAIADCEREAQPYEWRADAALLVQASWDYFDEVEAAAPRSLRKGPRGGGRDTDAIRQHLLDTDHAYAPKIGVPRRASLKDVRAAVIRAILDDRQPARASEWPAAYVARRYAWHSLDHAWEIEDRIE